jgi:hypothetical protein
MRATERPVLKGSRCVAVFVLLAVMIGGVWPLGQAKAETFTMTCKNSRYTYRVSFDDETQRFQWASDAGKVDYLVMRVKVEEQGITVWGKVRRFGNDFIAFFSEEGWIKNFYANGSSMTDICQGRF